MSSNSKLMDTEPGGEQTPYEESHPDVEPHAKLAGQLGHGSSTSPSTTMTAQGTEQSNPQIGLGGQTTNATGKSGNGNGNSEGEEAARARRTQGYGGGKDMDRHIGA